MPFIQFQMRRGLAAEWILVNPTLAAGEFGYETDTGSLKIGNGIDPWNNLPYVIASTINFEYPLISTVEGLGSAG